MFRLLTRITRHLFLFSLIVIAVLLTAIRIFVFCIDLYKHELEYELSKLFAAPVTIGQLSAKMHRLYPEIVLKNITLSEDKHQQAAITLKELRLGIDLLDILLKGEFIAATRLSLIGAKLSVIREKDGRFTVVGLKGDDSQPLWLLQGERYQLLKSEISWQDKKRDGKKLTFKNIDLVIKNNVAESRHQIHFLAQLPSQYGNMLRISSDIKGNIFEPENLDGSVYIAGENIQFTQFLTTQLPLGLSLNQGSGDFQLWGELKHSELNELNGEIRTRNLSLQSQDKKRLEFEKINGKFAWQGNLNDWKLAVQNLQLQRSKSDKHSADFAIAWKRQNKQQLTANIQQLDLSLLTPLNQFFAPLVMTKNSEWLKNASIKGKLHNALLFADLTHSHYALKADFDKVSVAKLNHFPEFNNLSGSIRGTQQQGTVFFNSQNMLVDIKNVFRAPLEINRFKGQLNWEQFCEELQLTTNNLQLDSPYLNSQNRFSLSIPKNDSSVFIDWQTAFYDIKDVSQLKRYFPLNTMSNDTIAWLDRAFVKGQVKRGDMLLYGNLDDFPFDKKQGVFQVIFEPSDLELAYAEKWPNLKSMNAKVMFLNEGLEVNVKQAKAGKVTVEHALVKIPSLDESRYLSAEIAAKGAIADTLDWLQQTPLDLSLAEVKEQIAVKGQTILAADLKIPLTETGNAKVSGTAKLNNAALTVKAIDLPITGIKGILKFSEALFYAPQLQASTLGYPLRIKIEDSPTEMVIKANGEVGSKQLQQHFKWSLDFAKGSSDYQLQLTLPVNKASHADLRIESKLTGISLELPATLAKKSDENKAITLQMSLNDEPLLPITLTYNNNLTAKLKLYKEQTKLHSGNILLGRGKVDFPLSEELNISVNQEHFSLLPWLALLDADHDENASENLLKKIDIKTPNLIWNQQKLGALTLNLKQENNQWFGFINSDFATGKLSLAKNKYTLDMEKIDLSMLKKLTYKNDNQKTKIQALPQIDINSQQLLWRGVNLGKLSIKSQRHGNDIYFNDIQIANNEQRLSMTGKWQLINHQQHTQLQGQLTAKKFGALLKKLDLSEDFKETSANINFALNWQSAPYDFSLAALNGHLDLNLDDGRISSIEPGFGRLLGVLAVAQWIKRLKLDFGDIYKEGLTFDTINAHYSLKNGIAHSDDLVVDAVPAKITLKGDVNLGNKTLNKEIAVIPKSSAALPIAGTIVGGIATAIAQTVTGEYEEGFYLRTKYQVQGKWNQLKVIPLHEQDGLLQKTWRGITDFSWINEQEEQDETNNE